MRTPTAIRRTTRRTSAWRAVFAALILAALVVIPLQGMIFTLTLLELVKQSEFILVATVEKVRVVGTGRTGGGLPLVDLENELAPVESLKGAWPSGRALVLATFKPEKGWLEDNVEIPPVGSRVLLFLMKGRDHGLVPVNGIQGVWPMDGDTLLGMGFTRTLADVRVGVKKAEAAGVFAQGLVRQTQGDLKGAVDKYTLSLRDWPDNQLQLQVSRLERTLQRPSTSGSGSGFERDSIPCGQADQDGEPVPDDFSITTGGGPAHADWGGASSITINARGEVSGRVSRRGQPDAAAPAVRPLTPQAVKRIYAQVLACGFFDLEPEYRDRRVMDGGVDRMAVTANGKTHTVVLANFTLDRLSAITRVLEEELQASARLD